MENQEHVAANAAIQTLAQAAEVYLNHLDVLAKEAVTPKLQQAVQLLANIVAEKFQPAPANDPAPDKK
jgi:hypothetical protein